MTETAFRVVVTGEARWAMHPPTTSTAKVIQERLSSHGWASVTVTPMDDALIEAAEDAVDVLDMTAKGHADDGIRFHCAAKLQDAIANARGDAK